MSASAASASGTVGLPGWIWLVGIAGAAMAGLAIVFRGRREDVDEA